MTTSDSKLLGEYLLRGWIMLAEYCEKEYCMMPLMKNRSSGETLCVSCKTTCSTKNKINGVADDKNEVDNVDPEKAHNNHDISTALGSYLLRGWVMMNETCVKCNIPLVRTKNSSQILCVGCSCDYAQPSPSSIKQQPETPPIVSNVSAFTGNNDKTLTENKDEISNMLRIKLKSLANELLLSNGSDLETLDVMDRTLKLYKLAKEIGL